MNNVPQIDQLVTQSPVTVITVHRLQWAALQIEQELRQFERGVLDRLDLKHRHQASWQLIWTWTEATALLERIRERLAAVPLAPPRN